ncbi:MAG: hypothetical protein P4N24_21800 [Acidobacteriota bacterium]|nr:hypothetical protein [Acidobacteriota bacterium]
MARGWESKSVESQMETSQSNKDETARKKISLEAAEAMRKKETLLLGRAHVQQQLQASQHPRHRAMLQSALTDLDKQLADLGAPDHAVDSQ